MHPGEKKIAALPKLPARVSGEGIKGRYPNIERVEVQYEGTTLPAWFMKAPMRRAGRRPCVFSTDSTARRKSSILFGGVELANRGIHTAGDRRAGQGEALRLQNIPSRYDYEVPAAAAYDYVSEPARRRSQARRGDGVQHGRLLCAARRRI